MQGLTGTIKFDNQGFRTNFLLDVIELNKEGLSKIGSWNSTEGINFTRTYGEAYTQIVESLMNKTFTVCIILVRTVAPNNINVIEFTSRVLLYARSRSNSQIIGHCFINRFRRRTLFICLLVNLGIPPTDDQVR